MKFNKLVFVSALACATNGVHAAKNGLDTVDGVVTQIATIQTVIYLQDLLGDIYTADNGGADNGNCDPDMDGKKDGTAETENLTDQDINTSFAPLDQASFNLAKRVWNKCAIIKDENDKNKVTFSYTRTGQRLTGNKTLTNNLGTINFVQLGEAKKPFINSVLSAVQVGSRVFKQTYDFKSFYRSELHNKVDSNDADLQDLLMDYDTKFFGNYGYSSFIGDSKSSKDKPIGTPFRVIRHGTQGGTGAPKEINGTYGYTLNLPGIAKKQLAQIGCDFLGSVKVETTEAMEGTGFDGLFGTVGT